MDAKDSVTVIVRPKDTAVKAYTYVSLKRIVAVVLTWEKGGPYTKVMNV